MRIHNFILAASIWYALTGCVAIAGTPEGVKAASDALNGVVRTGKESPEQASEYFAHRGTQEREVTARKAQAIGFWQRLTN